jgi:peptide/nickel transport system ATP-binding protein
MIGLSKNSSGKVLVNGINHSLLKGEEYRYARRRLQMVFQDPQAALSPHMPAGQAIMEPLRGVAPARSRKQRVLELMEQLDLGAELYGRLPRELSGGQNQRVALARALACQPQLIVCDEATSALDISTQAHVISLLKKAQLQHGIGILFISHDLALLRNVCDRIMTMVDGRLDIPPGPV